MKKFGGPGPGPYEKNTGIGEIPAAGPCDVKGLLCYQLQLLKIIPATRWLQQTDISHTLFLNEEYVVHTQKFGKF